MATTYRLKKTVRPKQRVRLTECLKPRGRTIHLDDATQAQLKYLYDIGHSFVEIAPEPKKEKSGSDKS